MVAVAVAVPFGVAQFVTSVLPHVTLGGATVLPTTAEHVAVQPVVVLVTVTVYVPGLRLFIVDVVALLLHR